MMRAESVEQSRFHQTMADGGRAHQLDASTHSLVGCQHETLKRTSILFHAFCVWPKLLAEVGESVAGWMSLDQPTAKVLLERGKAPVHSGLVHAQGLTHDDTAFERTSFLNLTSTYDATCAALPQMVQQNHGRAIFIGSGYAKRSGGLVAYTAATMGLSE
jgi:NAD(P)-dependent dehydrogenase (short-subunit alcohol dehydrogenase family)